jgi:hypothetical protein
VKGDELSGLVMTLPAGFRILIPARVRPTPWRCPFAFG